MSIHEFAHRALLFIERVGGIAEIYYSIFISELGLPILAFGANANFTFAATKSKKYKFQKLKKPMDFTGPSMKMGAWS